MSSDRTRYAMAVLVVSGVCVWTLAAQVATGPFSDKPQDTGVAVGSFDQGINRPSPLYYPGACCLSDGSCVWVEYSECIAQGGGYPGTGTFCQGDADSNGIDDLCQVGACCTIDMGCVPAGHDFCFDALGGVEFFLDAQCPEQPGDPDPCQGACCRCVPNIPPPGCASWQCYDRPGGACGGPWDTWLEGEECSQFECGACSAVGVRSCKVHGPAGELNLDMGISGGVEPRIGGISKLEIDLDKTLGFEGGVTVDCTPTAWAGAVTVTGPVNDTVTLEFAPVLPDQAYCTIELDCGAEVCVRMCEGDMNRSGTTDTTDASNAKLRFGQTATNANCEWDYDRSGEINTTDAASVKLRFGKQAPDCP